MRKVKIESWLYGSDHYLKGDIFPKEGKTVENESIKQLLKDGIIEDVKEDKKDK